MRSADRDSQDKNLIGLLDRYAKLRDWVGSILTHVTSIFGYEIYKLITGPKVAHVLSFYPKGSKLSLVSLYGQPFSRYELIFFHFRA